MMAFLGRIPKVRAATVLGGLGTVLAAACVLGGAPPAGATGAPPHADAGAATMTLALSPAPDDLELAQVSYPHAPRGRFIDSADLHMRRSATFGSDYLVVARAPGGAGRHPRLLVLLVNRPSALLDPAIVRLTLSSKGLGRPVATSALDPLARTPSRRLCDLTLGAGALDSSRLGLMRASGAALSGFGARAAVAQAYDLVCGLPHESAFAQAVSHPSSPAPVETPETPVEEHPAEPPRCSPCGPIVALACPQRADIECPLAGGARRPAAGLLVPFS